MKPALIRRSDEGHYQIIRRGDISEHLGDALEMLRKLERTVFKKYSIFLAERFIESFEGLADGGFKLRKIGSTQHRYIDLEASFVLVQKSDLLEPGQSLEHGVGNAGVLERLFEVYYREQLADMIEIIFEAAGIEAVRTVPKRGVEFVEPSRSEGAVAAFSAPDRIIE